MAHIFYLDLVVGVTMNILLLGSASRSRQRLLKEACIPFEVVGHSADESLCDWNASFDEILKTIAQEKMKHVILPDGRDGQERFVLTADTMCQDFEGVIHGKPLDKADAIQMLKSLRKNAHVATAFCLDKKQWVDGAWHTKNHIVEVVSATVDMDIPDAWIERCFDAVPHYHSMAGAFTIEGYGAQFFKSINGSYTTIIGLPMAQVREALQELGFFDDLEVYKN